jgi:hypothetical protein
VGEGEKGAEAMTREELEQVKRSAELALHIIARAMTPAEIHRLFATFNALEAAWAERDNAIKDGLVQALKIDELTEEIESLKLGYRGFP